MGKSFPYMKFMESSQTKYFPCLVDLTDSTATDGAWSALGVLLCYLSGYFHHGHTFVNTKLCFGLLITQLMDQFDF